MRRLLLVLTVAGVGGFLAFPGTQRVQAPGPTASIGDWHLTVLAITTDTSAGAPHPVPADGVFRIVTVHVIGDGRFEARLLDANGRLWERATDVERVLPGGPRRLVFDAAGNVDPVALELRRPGSRRVVEVTLPGASGSGHSP